MSTKKLKIEWGETRIELVSLTPEASILPLYYTPDFFYMSFFFLLI